VNLAQSHEDMIGCRYHIPVIIVVAELLSQVYEAVQYFALLIEAGHEPTFPQLCVVIRISTRPNPCYPSKFLYADEHDTIGRDSG